MKKDHKDVSRVPAPPPVISSARLLFKVCSIVALFSCDWRYTMYPIHPFPHALPGAILPSRLAWLCQPEQIERTLSLLFALNSWKRAGTRLLFDDRRGLQKVQFLVLTQAYWQGRVQAATYLDGTAQFPGALLLGSAAENAARGLLIHLKSLGDPASWPPFSPQGDRLYQRFIRPFYRRITGHTFSHVTEAAGALELPEIRAFLQEQLHKLVTRSKRTRQPMPLRALSRLCIAPVDLLPIKENRVYFLDGYETWEDLDWSDLRKLDPEGESQVALRYASSTAEFVFHLPFRQASLFVSPERLSELQQTPGTSREYGLFQGRLIVDEASLQRPAQEILAELGIELASVCPHCLVDKQAYLTRPEIRDLLWPTIGHDPHAWMDDPWDGLCLPPTAR